MRRRTYRALLCALALVGGGCASDQEAGGGAEVTQGEPPLTFEDVGEVSATEPAGALKRLWFWAQWGSAPNVLGMYDPRVRELIGPSNIASVYAIQRGTLVAYRPRVVSEVRKRSLAFLAVEGRQKGQPPLRYSFLLRPSGESWKIVHDTLLEEGLVGVLSERIDGPGSSRSGPSRTARREALALTERYRTLYVADLASNPRGGLRPSADRNSSGQTAP